MNSIVTQRFIQCHDQLKANKKIRSSRQFAQALDYLPQSFCEVLKSRRDVTIELIRKAAKEYKINPNYLFTGEGAMFLPETADEATDELQLSSGLRVLTIVNDMHDDEKIVHVPAAAQAGYVNGLGNPSFMKELPVFSLPDYKYKVGTHRSFDIMGDSMETTLFEGDKVVCSFIEPSLWETAIRNNYVYVFVSNSEIIIGRAENFISSDKTVKISPDNANYETRELKVGAIQEVWYVRARISPFLPSPQNLKNTLQSEMSELKRTLQEQQALISNLYKTIEKLTEK